MSIVQLSPDGRVARGPALVDLQVNGYAGIDFNTAPAAITADTLRAAAAAMRRRGVCACLATLITDATDTMIARAARITQLCQADKELAAAYPGLHIEGPFISPHDGPRGAHPKAHATTPRQRPDFLKALWEASQGRVKLLTVAPEVEGAVELIEQAAGMGIVVAIGHTAAEPADLAAAVKAGARFSTHLGNGSHGMLPRLVNYVQWQLAEDALSASFIADGVHMPFYTLRNFLRAKSAERSVLVTDSVLADAKPGRYPHGLLNICLDESGKVTLADSQTLAGSALTLDRAILNVHRQCGFTLDQAWAMASTQPAKLVGLGSLPTIEVVLGERDFTEVRWL